MYSIMVFHHGIPLEYQRSLAEFSEAEKSGALLFAWSDCYD